MQERSPSSVYAFRIKSVRSHKFADDEIFIKVEMFDILHSKI
jgi:hypothetical protein